MIPYIWKYFKHFCFPGFKIGPEITKSFLRTVLQTISHCGQSLKTTTQRSNDPALTRDLLKGNHRRALLHGKQEIVSAEYILQKAKFSLGKTLRNPIRLMCPPFCESLHPNLRVVNIYMVQLLTRWETFKEIFHCWWLSYFNLIKCTYLKWIT